MSDITVGFLMEVISAAIEAGLRDGIGEGMMFDLQLTLEELNDLRGAVGAWHNLLVMPIEGVSTPAVVRDLIRRLEKLEILLIKTRNQ